MLKTILPVVYYSNINKHTNPSRAEMLKTTLIVVYCSNINKPTNPPRTEMLKTILLVIYCSNINKHANPPRVEMLKSIFLVVWTGLNWLLPVFFISLGPVALRTGCNWLQPLWWTDMDRSYVVSVRLPKIWPTKKPVQSGCLKILMKKQDWTGLLNSNCIRFLWQDRMFVGCWDWTAAG